VAAQPAPVVPAPQQPAQQTRPPAVPVGAIIGMTVAFLAIWMAQQKLQQEEEEEVTPHTTDPSTSFEYKIIRNQMGAFKNPVKFRAMLEEEARAGWELYEKLDHARVRLRRPVSWRDRDADLAQDPYRTQYGSGEGMLILWIVLGALFAIGLVIGILALTLK
jgi:hypothetical protein